MARVNRSKYNFSKLEVGDTFEIPPIDLLSMKNSLRFYNNKHRKGQTEIVVKHTEISDAKLEIERTA